MTPALSTGLSCFHVSDHPHMMLDRHTLWDTCVSAASRDTRNLVQVFADQLDAWMEEFHGLLNFQTAALPESDPEKETLPDAVRAVAPTRAHAPPRRPRFCAVPAARSPRASAMRSVATNSVLSGLPGITRAASIWQGEIVACHAYAGVCHRRPSRTYLSASMRGTCKSTTSKSVAAKQAT